MAIALVALSLHLQSVGMEGDFSYFECDSGQNILANPKV